MEKISVKSELTRLRDSLFPAQIRGSSLQRWVQISCAVLVLSILLICIFTLVPLNHQQHSQTHEQSLLVTRIQATLPSPVKSSIWDLSQDDIFISVKTSAQFHQTRLAVILKTWFQLSKRNTWFFTDAEDSETGEAAHGHLVVTQCPPDHSRQALSCKMQAEFDMYLRTNKKWFCHFDDDQYVNVLALEEKLRGMDSELDWYLGKPSIEQPLEIMDRDSHDMKNKISFWFATGGAGFCLSRHLAEKMRGVAADGRFTAVADKMRLPDDVTMGYVVEYLSKVPMTRVKEFHSHLEPLRLVSDLENQISFSYSSYGSEMNVIEVEGFDEEEDPTRFMSLHCRLFPRWSWCPGQDH